MLKSTDFDATYDFIVTKSKGMQKTPEFDTPYDPIVIKSKGMLNLQILMQIKAIY